MAQPSHREQLIRGAIRCLQTKGYARTTTRDIAAASGANLASIGYHFGSKEALLNEAMIRIFKRRNWKVGEPTLTGKDVSPLDRLTTMFIAAGEVFEAPRPLFVAFIEAIAQTDRSEELREQLAAHYREARSAIAGTVHEMFGEAADRLGSDAEVIASMFMALFDGLVLQWLLDPDDTPKGEALFTSLVDMITLALDVARPVATAGRGRGAQKRKPTKVRSSRGSRATSVS